MKTEELKIIMDAVHNALAAVRCLESETKKNMLLISKKELRAYLGSNLEEKLVEAYKILETDLYGGSDGEINVETNN